MKPDLIETVLNSSTELAIIATCPAGVIQVFNTAAEIMLGYTVAEVIGRATLTIFHDAYEKDDFKARRLTRFSQGDGSDRRRKSGIGLSLAISKALALKGFFARADQSLLGELS